MFCNQCGKEIREGAAFCPGCGAKVKTAGLPQRPVEAGAEKTAASAAGISEGSHGGASGTTTQAKKKSKAPLLIGLLLALLAVGAGAWFFFLRGKSVNLNDYIVMTYEDYSDGKEARAGFDVVKLMKDNAGAFQMNDGTRQEVRKYIQEKYAYLMMDSLVDAAAQAQVGLLGAVSGQELSQDEGLASLALVAAVADSTAPGGNTGSFGTLFPQIKNGSKIDKADGLKDGDTIQFSWGEVDKEAVERLFKLKLSFADASFTVGEERPSEGASQPGSGQQAEGGSLSPAADTTSSTGAAEATTSADEPAPALTEPSADPEEEKYQQAVALYAARQYKEASTLFAQLGTYKNSESMFDACIREMAAAEAPTTPAPTTAAPTTAAPTTAAPTLQAKGWGNRQLENDENNSRYIFYSSFYAEDNTTEVKPSVTFQLSIQNSVGKVVFRKTYNVTEKDYGTYRNAFGAQYTMVPLYIPYSEIEKGASASGIVTVSATLSGGATSWKAESFTIKGLPLTEAASVPTAPTAPSSPGAAGLYVGGIVRFGSYEQDGNIYNGQEPIEWEVFAEGGGQVWLISRYILDARPFHNRLTNTTYADSSIRQWLNSNFLNQAFTSEERGKLQTLDVDAATNIGNPLTYQGIDVYDKVALLSLSEVEQYFSENHQGIGTAYAAQQGLYVETNGYSPWWTRSLGENQSLAAIVRSSGGYNYQGRDLTIEVFGVRPCISLSVTEALNHLEETEELSQAEIVRRLYALPHGGHLPGSYSLTGQVVEIVTPYDSKANCITVKMLVTDYDHLVTAYKLTGGSNISMGDIITVTGRLTRYNEWYEFVEGASYTP